MSTEPIEILLIDHEPGDVHLLVDNFRDMKLANPINIIEDIHHVMAYLNRSGPYAGASRPDVILLEPFLPDHNAIDLMWTLNECSTSHEIPVILMLESKDQWEIIQNMGLSFYNYVTRPLSVFTLIKAITGIDNFRLMIAQ